ncbi:trypsin-like peptidase domain-containing protein [Verrucomicrobiaceae bacterium N1E253]|uniref:Trypsin-like peptidase domain-containing protein n=1 Tax=Oceaniferula marina TaxID=2748318 RepID=A0A851GHZ2_9BACT|nr:trypsin-like peptidase domain-containing protein [Oceaniferula marina]NWK57143.1 trypsin-like peptidase domain-containing protein [Oceaniferula marina]
MKLKKSIHWGVAAGLMLANVSLVQADIKEDARKVFADQAPSVLGVRGVLKVSITMNGQPGGNQEKELWSNGVVVADGLVAVAYRTIKPDLAANVGNRPGLKLESELSELKLIDASGEDYDAKLVLHDEDLGLAFVALNPEGDKAADFKASAVDCSKDVEVLHLDELIGVGRMSEKLRSEAQVNMGRVSAIVKRPRLLYIQQGISMSKPVFTQKGEFVGLTVALKNTGPVPVVLPAKYMRKLIDQAKEKQAELKK